MPHRSAEDGGEGAGGVYALGGVGGRGRFSGTYRLT